MIVGIVFTSGCVQEQKKEKKEVTAVVNGVEIAKDEFVQRLMLQAQGMPGIEQMVNETEEVLWSNPVGSDKNTTLVSFKEGKWLIIDSAVPAFGEFKGE